MAHGKATSNGLWGELQEACDTYLRYTFLPKPPDKPFVDHWKATGERAALAFLGMPLASVLLFRLRRHLLRLRLPLLPYLCEFLGAAGWRVMIGRHAEVGPGLVIPHGHVVIDGNVQIGRDCIINPWVTIGLSSSRRWGFDGHGPTIGDRVFIGTGAKLLGPITIGDDVRIGANAVVIDDVPAGATVVGAPARVVRSAPPARASAVESGSG